MRHFIAVLISNWALLLPAQLANAVTLRPGDILVADFQGNDGAIYKVDPVSGDREIVSGGPVGSGPDFSATAGILVDQDGSLIVTEVGTNIFIYSGSIRSRATDKLFRTMR